MTGRGGLEGIVAAASTICFIDGTKGILIYRGYDIRELAEHSCFEETCYLLLKGELPTSVQLVDFRRGLTDQQELPAGLRKILPDLFKGASPMEALRTSVSALACFDEEKDNTTVAANYSRALQLIARVPTLAAAYVRTRQGHEPVHPRADLGFAANFLYMLSGKEPAPEAARALDVALVLHAEHGFNASTFSARVTASTLSDIYSAITSAVGTLRGPLHGGANRRVMEMLMKIGEVDKAEGYVREALSRKERVMGFGHRVYKVEDPRATVLRGLSRKMGELAGDLRWYEMSMKLEQVVMREKGLYPNVDFYSASAYHSMGIPLYLFTPVFAVSRTSGWCAHVLEQYSDNRLIRPSSNYVGPAPRSYVPADRR
jgi:citrate synthase